MREIARHHNIENARENISITSGKNPLPEDVDRLSMKILLDRRDRLSNLFESLQSRLWDGNPVIPMNENISDRVNRA